MRLEPTGPNRVVARDEAPAAAKVLLLGGVDGCEGHSMRRYRLELRAALATKASSGWRFEEFTSSDLRLAGRLLSGVGGRLDSVLSRYIRHPARVATLEADLFHVTDHAYGQLLLRLDPRRAIVTCHDLIPLLAYRREIPVIVPRHVAYTCRLRVRLMRRAAFVIADSDATKRDLVRLAAYDPATIEVIHPGVSAAFRLSREDAAAKRDALGIPEGAQVIVSVGGNNGYKNVVAMLTALKILREQNRNIWFVRAGGDFTPADRKLIAQLLIADRVVHAGSPRADKELRDLYVMADVFAFPSWYEGFGWPPLEAMACGTPVVASDAGALPEVLGDAALLVKPADFAGLAMAIGRLLDDQNLHAEMMERGIRRARHFSWDNTAGKLLRVYERVLRRPADAFTTLAPSASEGKVARL